MTGGDCHSVAWATRRGAADRARNLPADSRPQGHGAAGGDLPGGLVGLLLYPFAARNPRAD